MGHPLADAEGKKASGQVTREMVELNGIEPSTSYTPHRRPPAFSWLRWVKLARRLGAIQKEAPDGSEIS